MSEATDLSKLSPEQREVVDCWGQGLAVLAGAGSGKTTTLVIKCAELLRRDPEARFAAVSFTEKSASDLRAKLARMLPVGASRQGHWVMTIHGLCATILREFPKESGFEGEETMLAEAEARSLWEEVLEELYLGDGVEPELLADISRMAEREGRDGLVALLTRLRDLEAFGVVDRLEDGASDLRSDARRLTRVARAALSRYERMKRRRGALDFNDLEKGAERALAFERVRRAYRERFSLVMVDEFQDTNPVQARILNLFVREDFSNLCVVGDPKQSIYRFRDADVTVFEDFCRKLPRLVKLTWNFRSRPGILDLTNRVCEPIFESSLMDYVPLVPKREADLEEEPVVRLDLAEPLDLARFIAAEVARGIRLEDMALLLRRIRGGNEKLLKALSSAGIPVALGSGGLFWEDPRVRECVALLKWWDQGENNFSGAVFLRAPWMRLDDRLLDEWKKTDPTWVGPFFSPANPHPIARALEPLRHKGSTRPGEVLLALLIDDEIEAEIGISVLGLWHRVEELSQRGLGFHEVVREIARSVEESRRERDVPPPRNEGQLSVLTLHGSKGLEFPHVILVDLGKKSRSPNAPLLFWDRREGAYLCDRDSDGERDSKNPVELKWRALERAKEVAESKRLFYVALTRAKERLILALPILDDKEQEKIREDADKTIGEDHWRGWLELLAGEIPEAQFDRTADLAPLPPLIRGENTSPPRERPQVELRRPRHSVTEWNVFSQCPRQYEWKYLRAPVGGLEKKSWEKIRTGWAISDPDALEGREIGTRVHGCLERRDWEGLKELEKLAGKARFDSDPLIAWAKSASIMELPQPDSGWLEWSELPFEIPVENEVIVGSIDRLIWDEKRQRFRVIDFKVTEQDKPEAELIATYRMQLELYAEAVRRLEPWVEAHQVEAMLVHISGKSVREILVPLAGIDANAIAREVSRLVQGAEGKPVPGKQCWVCDFRTVCPEAAQRPG